MRPVRAPRLGRWSLTLLSAVVLSAAVHAGPGGDGDALRRLETDPSPAAAERLSELYRGTESPDQRFWVVQALAVRLKEHGDAAALETLLAASEDADPGVRGPALRGLAGFGSLPEKAVRETWLARLDVAARSGARDSAPGVRGGAADLLRALRLWKEPGARKTLPPPDASASGLRLHATRALRWLWIVVLPLAALVWIKMGLPVFDGGVEEGRSASAAWKVLRRQRVFLCVTALLWLCLGMILAGYGFDALVWLIGRPLYAGSETWFRAYFAAAFCLFGPGALLAAGLARRPEGCAATASLRSLPWVLALCGAVFAALVPVEAVYRLLLRGYARGAGAKSPAKVLFWILETGSLRSGYLAAAVMARERRGLLPALQRGSALFPAGPEGLAQRGFGFGAFDPRFALLGAAPVLALLCATVAKRLPAHWSVPLPVVILACSLWAWGVLAGILFAVLQTLEGVGAAARYLRVAEPQGRLPGALAGLAGHEAETEDT
ncbi:MAG: hypothetical protein ABII00_02100 [Elusimicrobiota bacterium]